MIGQQTSLMTLKKQELGAQAGLPVSITDFGNEACEGQSFRLLPSMLQLCKITDALFISNARSGCSNELIQQEAVTFCINVSKQQPFPTVGVATLRIPVYDDPNEDLYSHFDRCADAIQQEANRGGHSVVYCKNGRSRSAAICVAYLMKHQKLSLTEALQKVKTARHVIEPNAGFMVQLQKYEQELNLRQRGADRVHIQA